MTSEHSYCPVHGKPIQAKCPSCGRLLCSDCIRFYDGKCLCENCAPAIIKEPALSAFEGSKGLLYLLLVVGVILLLAVSLGVYGLSNLGESGLLGGANQLRMFRVGQALMELSEDIGRFPTTEEGLALLTGESAFAQGEEGEDWYGPYLPKNDPHILEDIYGQQLLYGKIPDGDYYVHSIGVDGKVDFDPARFEETRDEGDDLILLLGTGEVEGGEVELEEELVFGKPVMKGGIF